MSGLLRRLGFGRPSRIDLETRITEARRRARGLEQQLQTTRIELELTKQARLKADADATYWRERAERFIDDISLNRGILSAPAMQPPKPAPDDAIGGIFGALNQSEINNHAATAADTSAVVGVNPDAARAALDDFHRDAVRTPDR